VPPLREAQNIILFLRLLSTSSLRGAVATKQSMFPRVEAWIASAFAKALADKSLRSQ
jgi:hypothetical protein